MGAGQVGAITRVYVGRWSSGDNYNSVGWALVKWGQLQECRMGAGQVGTIIRVQVGRW